MITLFAALAVLFGSMSVVGQAFTIIDYVKSCSTTLEFIQNTAFSLCVFILSLVALTITMYIIPF